MTEQFGLSEDVHKYIKDTIANFDEIEKVVIFGSRAIGNFKPGSDIDLAIFGDKVSIDTISRLKGLLQDQGPLPYIFDIVHYESIKEEALKDHIKKFGIIFSRKSGHP